MEQATGAPLLGLIPAILEPHPDYPHDSISAVRTVYLLNAELNHASSVLANAFRLDAARIMMYLAGKGLDEKAIDIIMNGGDLEWVKVESETLEGLFKEVDLPTHQPDPAPVHSAHSGGDWSAPSPSRPRPGARLAST